VSRFFAYLIRFAVIIFGYGVASLAASAFIHLLFIGWSGLHGGASPPHAMAGLVFSIPFVALFVAYFGFMPTVVVIAFGEILGKRHWLFYAIGGAVTATVFLGLAHGTADADFDVAGLPAMLAIIGSGMVGGICFWLIAGRWAGNWRLLRKPNAS
jgi:hypothetical protein